jgi:hypothetical protein
MVKHFKNTCKDYRQRSKRALCEVCSEESKGGQGKGVVASKKSSSSSAGKPKKAKWSFPPAQMQSAQRTQSEANSVLARLQTLAQQLPSMSNVEKFEAGKSVAEDGDIQQMVSEGLFKWEDLLRTCFRAGQKKTYFFGKN